MVSIPLADQHVHRFVWRDCETKKEPDIYVKTVLTFGDRPAPAMATTAMRKTARLKEDVKPRAAEANSKHQNGCSESVVKSCKLALKKGIGDTLLTPFELYTCLLEVSNLLNQRPIGKLSQDPDDGAYLCPNNILLARATNSVPQGPFRDTKTHGIDLNSVKEF